MFCGAGSGSFQLSLAPVLFSTASTWERAIRPTSNSWWTALTASATARATARVTKPLLSVAWQAVVNNRAVQAWEWLPC